MISVIREKFSELGKREKFLAILGLIAVLGVLLSIATKVSLLHEDEDSLYRIAVVGPGSDQEPGIGRSIRQGVEYYAEIINGTGGIGGTSVAIDYYQDNNDPDTAREIAKAISADTRNRAVVGHWSSAAAIAAGEIYKASGIPLITSASLNPETIEANQWLFSILYNNRKQARFLANYGRNVLGQKLISVIYSSTDEGKSLEEDFAATYKRFGTKVHYRWEVDVSANVEFQLQNIVAELKSKKDAGMLFLALDEDHGARLLTMLRDARIRNPIIGPNTLGTQTFLDTIADLGGDSEAIGRYSDRMLVSVPLLFDTANEVAQNFKNGFIDKYEESPDWVAAHAYDSAHVIVEVIKKLVGKNIVVEAGEGRKAVRAGIAWITEIEDAITGVTGSIYFDLNGEAQKPVFVGVYNGADIISALTQLQPIKVAGAQNYIEELKKGRVLYVNDRFMYKTNVVYTGVQINEVSELDRELNEYLLDFAIWFRYRGEFNPQDIEFANAAEPIDLGEAIDENQLGDLKYRLYRVQGKFQFNFSDTKREYGHHLVGVAFTHSELNKNNLQYVVDVLGVGLNTGETYQDKLEKVDPLDPATGWVVDRAWISQDIVGRGTMGNPDYVGFAAAEPDFSEISVGIVVKRGEINMKDFIPGDWFIYICIFALIGSVFAVGMDRRDRGRFWTVQSWALRVVSWPFLLLSMGNLLLDFAVQNLPDHYIGIITLTYATLWWIVPARLLGMAIHRFLWVPLEDHTERTIPNVIRVFVSVTIYAFAGCGVVAFVFDQALTSILASTGLLAMIIGLAVQSNISNIFSGIVINMERPFNVGDWVQIGDLDEGRVVDITWRTVRIKVRNGYVLSLPNGQVSEAQIHNFSSFDSVRLEVPFYLDVKYPFVQTSEIMEQGLAKAPQIVDMPPREVRFKGARWDFAWIAEYEIQFWINHYGRKEEIAEAAMICVWEELRAHGIELHVPNGDDPAITGPVPSLPAPDDDVVEPEPA